MTSGAKTMSRRAGRELLKRRDMKAFERGRKHLLTALLPEEGMARISLICTEADSAKSSFLTELAALLLERGFESELIDCRGASVGSVLRRLAAAKRRAKYTEELRAIFLFHVEPFDEIDCHQLSLALRKCANAGLSSFVSLSPEAVQLAEELGEARLFVAEDLLVEIEQLGISAGAQRRVEELSNRTAQLVDCLLPSVREEWLKPNSRYYSYLLDIFEQGLRDALIPEEKRLRFALFFLGEGKLSNIDASAMNTADSAGTNLDVVGTNTAGAQFDPCIVSDLQRFSSFYGIDDELEHFQVAGLYQDEIFARFLELQAERVRVAAYSKFGEETTTQLFEAVVEQLIADGSFFRAVRIIEHFGMSERAAVRLLKHAEELLNRGEFDVVDAALALAGEQEHIRDSYRALKLSHYESALSQEKDAQGSVQGNSRLELLGDQQDLRQTAVGPLDLSRKLRKDMSELLTLREYGHYTLDQDQLSLTTELFAHCLAAGELFTGRFAAALGILLAHGADLTDTNSYSGAILQLDVQLLRLLCGDFSEYQSHEQRAEAARNFLGRHEFEYRNYLSVCDAIQELLVSSERGLQLEKQLAYAEKTHDYMFHAGLLLLVCLGDLCARSFTRAHVRAERACEAAARAQSPSFERLARALNLIARSQMGDPLNEEALQELISAHDNFNPLYQLLLCMARGINEAVLPERLPRELAGLLLVLTRNIPGFSKEFAATLPPVWSEELDVLFELAHKELVVEGQLATGSVLAEAAHASTIEFAPTEDGPDFELHTLGRVALSFRGTLVPELMLEKRRAKLLLVSLAASRGHCMRRFALTDSIWPDCPYIQANDRLYQACAQVKRAVAQVGEAPSLLQGSREDGLLGFKNELVRCDVDEFEQLAHLAFDNEGNDEAVVAYARRAEDLYVGDLFSLGVDATGMLEARRKELRALCVDVLVLGADAALRLGRSKSAVQLSERARLLDDLREDVMGVVMRSLGATGREREAKQLFYSYSSQYLKVHKKSPSRELLKLVSEPRSSARASA